MQGSQKVRDEIGKWRIEVPLQCVGGRAAKNSKFDHVILGTGLKYHSFGVTITLNGS